MDVAVQEKARGSDRGRDSRRLAADTVKRAPHDPRVGGRLPALLRINFKSPPDLDDHCYHVRLGPSPREEFGRNGRTKGGGVLAFIDELFWLEEHWSLPPPASPARS